MPNLPMAPAQRPVVLRKAELVEADLSRVNLKPTPVRFEHGLLERPQAEEGVGIRVFIDRVCMAHHRGDQLVCHECGLDGFKIDSDTATT